MELRITMDKLTGEVKVNGPIDNPFVCYALLELAKDAIRAHNMAKVASKILIPQLHLEPAREH